MTYQDPEPSLSAVDDRRRRATILQAKAAAHPLRLRILRLCGQQPMTNKQLADRLDSQPGTTLYHVRLLVRAGLLEPAPIRTGASGALEKPYRASGLSWWLSAYGDTDEGEPYDDRDDESSLASIEAFQAELSEAGPGSVRTYARFMLHLSDEEVQELDRRLLAVLDEYIQTDHQRLDRPALGGIVVLHQLADPALPQPSQPHSHPLP
ncbi:MAG TPA: helix-turn-helix domain-containing protein [Blastococcus sp.]|jgi:DNA-binding transcriptional ArsR family regulator|nr:helix-turn-helix domain-containing protein [Blastococcus sp.]